VSGEGLEWAISASSGRYSAYFWIFKVIYRPLDADIAHLVKKKVINPQG
jgi:hypothetical protein